MNVTQTPLEKLRKQREGLIEYLKAKTDAEDWHAVQDAGSDLRELDVAITIREREQPLGV